jgi:hypothetical protein
MVLGFRVILKFFVQDKQSVNEYFRIYKENIDAFDGVSCSLASKTNYNYSFYTVLRVDFAMVQGNRANQVNTDQPKLSYPVNPTAQKSMCCK